jgi:hypothetical protein
MPVAETSNGPVTYEQLIEHCKRLRRVILLQDAAWSNYCNRNAAGQHELQEDVILMHPGYASALSVDRGPYRGRDIAAYDWAGHFSGDENFVSPNSIPGIIVRAVAQAWSVDESELQSAYANRLRDDTRKVIGVSKEGENVKSVRLSVVAAFSRE